MGFENLGTRALYNVGANFVINQTGFASFDGEYTTIKRGGLLYLVDVSERMLMDGASPPMDIWTALDEIAFNTLSLYAVEETELAEKLSQLIPIDGEMNGVLTSALVQTGIQEIGIRIDNQTLPLPIQIKHLANWTRLKLGL